MRPPRWSRIHDIFSSGPPKAGIFRSERITGRGTGNRGEHVMVVVLPSPHVQLRLTPHQILEVGVVEKPFAVALDPITIESFLIHDVTSSLFTVVPTLRSPPESCALHYESDRFFSCNIPRGHHVPWPASILKFPSGPLDDPYTRQFAPLSSPVSTSLV